MGVESGGKAGESGRLSASAGGGTGCEGDPRSREEGAVGGSLLGAGLCLHFPHPPHRVPSFCRGCWVLREPTRHVQGGRTGIQATAADSTAALEHPPGAGRCARRQQPQGRSRLVRDTSRVSTG